MIENYTISEWIAFFFIYSFLGWCVESTIVSLTNRKLTNRGFLKGPMLPLYGTGAVIVLLATLWAKDNILLVYFFGMFSATILEYATGVAMENAFNMKYWDYSDKKFNVGGYICLTSSLFWGALAVLLDCVLHVPISGLVRSIELPMLQVLIGVVFCLAFVDAVYAFKKAFDFQKLLANMTIVKRELADMTERFNDAKDAFAELSTEKQREYFIKQEEAIAKLHVELDAVKAKLGRFKNSMVRSFPSASSKKFGEALQEFKELFNIGK